jgi:hypothetical protein
MQPQGRKPCRFPSKVDHHILGCKNWWEGEMGSDENKAADRRDWKKEVDEELIDFFSNK